MNHEKRFGILIFFSWSLLLMIVCAIINYNGLYSQDSHEYLRFSQEISDFFKTGDAPGKFFWAVNYPLLGSVLAFVTGNAIALQLISILSAAWILYLLVMFLIREFPGREWEVAIYAILFMGLSPYFFRYAISTMSDVLAMAFTCTAYYLSYLRFRTGKFRLMIFILFFVSMAAFTRLALLPLLFPVVIWTGVDLLKNRKFLLLACSILVSLIPLCVYVYFKEQQSGDAFQHYLIHDWSVMNFFKNNFSTPDGNSSYTLPNLLFAFSFLVHPGFIFAGGIFLFILCFKKNQPRLLFPVMWIAMLLYLLFIAGIPSRNARYLVPVLPFYAAICFPAFLVVFAWLFKYDTWKNVVILGILMIQVVLLIRAFLPFYKINKIEQQVVEAVIDRHPALIYTFGIDGALRSFGYKGTIVSLWNDTLTSVENNSLLLFNRTREEQQWKGMTPMRNFYFITDSARAKKIETLESGWEIYQINEAYPAADTGLSTVRY